MNKRQKKKFRKKSCYKKYRVLTYYLFKLEEGVILRYDMKNDEKNKIRYACAYTGCYPISMGGDACQYKSEHIDREYIYIYIYIYISIDLNWKTPEKDNINAPELTAEFICKPPSFLREQECSTISNVMKTWIEGITEDSADTIETASSLLSSTYYEKMESPRETEAMFDRWG